MPASGTTNIELPPNRSRNGARAAANAVFKALSDLGYEWEGHSHRIITNVFGRGMLIYVTITGVKPAAPPTEEANS